LLGDFIGRVGRATADGKIHNQIDNILIGRGRHSSVLGVHSFREENCNTENYLEMANVRESSSE
jgi:hypothetical protein